MARFTNQATITYNGITTDSNVVTGEITQVISAWKTVAYDRYSTNDILTYVVSIQNSGDNDISGLVVTDDLGAYASLGEGSLVPLTYTGDPVLYYVNGVLQPTPDVTAGPPLVIRGIEVPAGLSSIIVYRVRVNQFAPLGIDEEIINTVTINRGGLSSDVTASETVKHDNAARLTVIKALNPTTVVENGRVVYTFTIQNTGATAADASAELVVSDTFTPALTGPIVARLNGTAWAAYGNYTYNAATGVFTTTAGRITVPAATYTQNELTGEWTVTPGVTVLTVSGTI